MLQNVFNVVCDVCVCVIVCYALYEVHTYMVQSPDESEATHVVARTG